VDHALFGSMVRFVTQIAMRVIRNGSVWAPLLKSGFGSSIAHV